MRRSSKQAVKTTGAAPFESRNGEDEEEEEGEEEEEEEQSFPTCSQPQRPRPNATL